MINTLFLMGKISRILVNEPKDPEKAKRRPGSGVLMIQYGPVRDSSGGPVDFVNAVLVRIPSYRWPQYRDKLKEGQVVEITGHLQGILKQAGMEPFFTVELVADRVHVVARSTEDNPFDFNARKPRRNERPGASTDGEDSPETAEEIDDESAVDSADDAA